MTTSARIDDAWKTLLWIGAGAAVATYILAGTLIYTRPSELVQVGGQPVRITQGQMQSILSLIAGLILPRILARYPALLEWLRGLLGRFSLGGNPAVTEQLTRIEDQGREILARLPGDAKPEDVTP